MIRLNISQLKTLRFRRLIPATCVLLWIAISTCSLLLSSSRVDTVLGVTNPLQRQLQVAAGVVLLFGLICSASRWERVYRKFKKHSTASRCLALTFVVMLTGAIARMSLTEISYVVFMFGSMVLAASIWLEEQYVVDYFMRCWFALMVILLFAAIAIYGWPEERWVGGIHPNILSFIVFVVATFAISRMSLAGYLVFLACFAIVVLLSSRYVILCMLLVAFTAFLTYTRGRLPKMAFVIVMTAGCLLIILTSPLILDVAYSLFLVDSERRGLGSGVTGRLYSIEESLAEFPDHWLFGVGFRNRVEYLGAHNGYINLLSEIGIIAGIMFFIVLLYCICVAIFEILASQSRNAPLPGSREMPYLFLASLLAAVFQPQLVNFGDVQGICFILGLSYVLTRRPVFRFSRKSAANHGAGRAVRLQ